MHADWPTGAWTVDPDRPGMCELPDGRPEHEGVINLPPLLYVIVVVFFLAVETVDNHASVQSSKISKVGKSDKFGKQNNLGELGK